MTGSPTTPTAPTQWTTRSLLAWMTQAFEGRDLDAPRRQAEMLVAHVIGCERLKLYTDPDRPATPIERDTLRGLVKRALADEPIQYLIGEEQFFGMRFAVDKRVLIPRPSTLTIVEEVLQHARKNPGAGSVRDSDAGSGILIADVCTGSGCIAGALAKHLPGARLIATDLSEDALDVARTNIESHGLSDRVDFARGNLLEAVWSHPAAGQAGALRYLCSNPPYISDTEWDEVPANVKSHEPEMALRGGADGLDLVRTLIADGPGLVASGGLLLIEVAASHADQALALAEQHPDLTRARVLKDSDALPRVVVAEKKN